MLVKATRLGFYNHLRRYPDGDPNRRAGEPFRLKSEKDFSPRWMERVDGQTARAKAQPESKEPPRHKKATGDSDVI